MLSLVFVIFLVCLLTLAFWTPVSRVAGGAHFSILEKLVLSYAIGCYAAYLGVTIIGPFSLTPLSMWLMLLAFVPMAAPSLKPALAAARMVNVRGALKAAARDKYLAALWLAAFAIALTSLLHGLAPPNDYDSLMYHLSIPELDVERGYMAVPWDRGLPHAFFPALGGNLSRLALTITGFGAAQMIHGTWSLVAGAGAACIAMRVGYGIRTALLAAIMFLSIRAVVWQMGSVEVDAPLAGFVSLSAIAYMEWRARPSKGSAILFGMAIGIVCVTKYHGFVIALCFAPVMIYDAFVGKKSSTAFFLGPLTAVIVTMPHFIRDFILIGNPVYPIFASKFNPDFKDFFGGIQADYGTGYNFMEMLIGPWRFSVQPMEFDGMMLGVPVLLAFFPFILFRRSALRALAPLLSVVAFYYFAWFWGLTQQVRYFLPVFSIVCAAAAIGATIAWSEVRSAPVFRAAFLVLSVFLTVNQAMFVGIYSVLRLPVIFGLTTSEHYLTKTPTMTGSFYRPCRFIAENLKPGERYYSQIMPQSFYCPQVQADYRYLAGDERSWLFVSRAEPNPSPEEFIKKLEAANYRFFIFPFAFENRQNKTGKAVRVDFPKSAFHYAKYFVPAITATRPVFKGNFVAVYDGAELLRTLKKQILVGYSPAK